MRPKALIGYSDITALHAAWQRAGLVSFHGPTARSPLSRFRVPSLPPRCRWRRESGHLACAGRHLYRARGRADRTARRWQPRTCRRAGGHAVGGFFREAIVVLEDIHEATYRVDRMLVQLRLAGAFDGCRAIMFGHFTDCPDTGDDGTPHAAISLHGSWPTQLGVPTLMGVPVGHIPEQWTLPLGAMATIDADAAHPCTVHRSTP
jgi:muramoyltetrapeptide carboxypeptidase